MQEVVSQEWKKKVRGKPFEKGHRQFNTGKTHFKKGVHPKTEFKKGNKLSDETRAKLSEAKKGEKHWNWKGGFNKKKYYKDHKEQMLMYVKNRRVKKKNAIGSHTLG